MPYRFPDVLALLSPMFPQNTLVVRKLLPKAELVKGMRFPSIQCVLVECGHILFPVPLQQTNSFVHATFMATFDDIFDCCAGAV